MATPAQCFYCFETLSASFERREPPSLAYVEEFYNAWVNSKNGQGRELCEDSAHSLDEDDLGAEGDEDDEDEDDIEMEQDPPAMAAAHPSSTLQLPRIGQLQAASESSSSSATSSQSALSNPSATSSMTSYSSAASRSLSSSYPLFVTWNTISRSNPSHKSLRGCIGTFEAQPLEHALQTYAITSALEDTRFNPIPATLLPSLSCSVTLLANFTACNDAVDWTIGVHGLRISFVYRGKRHGATYLPDVAVEQGWTKEETLESLMRKAGWDGNSSVTGVARRLLRTSTARSENISHPNRPWEDVSDFKAIRYNGLKANATYSEWIEWKRWVDK
ncbi:MAG: hypothetical protein Q9227_005684 [Pyrenula ochraceoflavens]